MAIHAAMQPSIQPSSIHAAIHAAMHPAIQHPSKSIVGGILTVGGVKSAILEGKHLYKNGPETKDKGRI